jgi:type IV pilus assembly protein PilE
MTSFTALRHEARGFTLVELLIAVVVVGILAGIAYPSFMDSIRKSRRSEAFAALTQVQQAQERWRSNRAAYSGSVSNAPTDDPPGLGMRGTTPNGYYSIGIVENSASANGYQAVAVGVDGTSQANDKKCRRLGVEMNGGNLRYAGCGPAASCELAFASTHSCWAR